MVLSIAKALPIQKHPDKGITSRFHIEDPEKFTDDNHKPEIAIALGSFEGFAGWKPTKDIQALFDNLPLLQRFLPNKTAKVDHEVVRQIVQTIMQ